MSCRIKAPSAFERNSKRYCAVLTRLSGLPGQSRTRRHLEESHTKMPNVHMSVGPAVNSSALKPQLSEAPLSVVFCNP